MTVGGTIPVHPFPLIYASALNWTVPEQCKLQVGCWLSDYRMDSLELSSRKKSCHICPSVRAGPIHWTFRRTCTIEEILREKLKTQMERPDAREMLQNVYADSAKLQLVAAVLLSSI